MDSNQVTVEVLKEVLDTIKSSKSFVIEQAPDLAQEIILDAKLQNIISFLLSLLFLVGGVLCLFGIDWNSQSGAFTPVKAVGTIICAGGIIGIFGFFCSIYELVSICAAPKLYILKEISKTIKNEC